MSIGVGIIGAGIMGADHARIIAGQVAGAPLVAISDADEARARAVAAETGARRVARDAMDVIHDPDVGNARKGNELAPRKRNLDLLKCREVSALGLRQADHHRKAPIALEDHTGLATAQSRGHDVLYVLCCHTDTGHGIAVHPDVEHG